MGILEGFGVLYFSILENFEEMYKFIVILDLLK